MAQWKHHGLEGTLEKKGNLLRWRPYHFSFSFNEDDSMPQLSYYDKPGGKLRNVVNASDIFNVERYHRSARGRSFVVETFRGIKSAGKTKWIIRASSREECARWMGALLPYVSCRSKQTAVMRSSMGFVLSELEVKSMASKLKIVIAKKGETVLLHGDALNSFYILWHGQLEVFSPTAVGGDRKGETGGSEGAPAGGGTEGGMTKIATIDPIASFGETVFLKLGSPCDSTVVASADSKLLVMDPKEVADFTRSHRGAVDRVEALFGSGEHVIDRLQQVSFLSMMCRQNLKTLVRTCHYQVLRPQEVLFYEGDRGDFFYIIFSGSVDILHFAHGADNQFEDGDAVVVNTLGAGSVFGEIALCLDIPRTATVKAASTTLLISINRRGFECFLQTAKLELYQVMRQRIIQTFSAYKIPFFSAIPKSRYVQLADKCKIESFLAKQVIFREGDIGDRFYIISYGAVDVTKNGRHIVTLRERSYFGEVALVNENSKRTATCTAIRNSTLLSITKDSFKEFFVDKPEALADVELKISGRKCHIEAVMYHPEALKVFTAYLRKTYASESIDFWIAARQFRKDAAAVEDEGKDPREPLRSKAAMIIERHVTEGAEQEVNIPATMREGIMGAFKSDTWGSELFVPAELELIKLLRRDKFVPFKSTIEFEHFIEAHGGYDVKLTKKQRRGGSILHHSIKLRGSSSRSTRRSKSKMSASVLDLSKARSTLNIDTTISAPSLLNTGDEKLDLGMLTNGSSMLTNGTVVQNTDRESMAKNQTPDRIGSAHQEGRSSQSDQPAGSVAEEKGLLRSKKRPHRLRFVRGDGKASLLSKVSRLHSVEL